MKKVMIFGAIALFGLSSCKKDWTCNCAITVNSATTKISYPLTNQTKSSASTTCDAFDTNYGEFGACELK
jgi:hypothetical protein